MLQEYFRYNDWANAKVLALCSGLSDSQLDAPRAMGFGSLRATLYHLLAAEELWQDRFELRPWMPLATAPNEISVAQVAERMRAVAGRRDALLTAESDSAFGRVVPYTNTEGNSFQHRLSDLALHVANHAVHHRAQSLNMLRSHGRSVPHGIDYLFYKLAYPSVEVPLESIAALRTGQLEVGETTTDPPEWDSEMLIRYCQYGNWAMEQVLSAAAELDDSQWNRMFDIGSGSLRSTLSHVVDAERWWRQNLRNRPDGFSPSSEETSCKDLQAKWRNHVAERDDWLRQQTNQSLSEIVEGRPGGIVLQFRRGEALLQLCGHGTHHRAQVVNMLRQLGQPIPSLDFVVWIRKGAPQ